MSPKTCVVIHMQADSNLSPGSLRRILDVFGKFRLNMAHIESQMKSYLWEGASFHIDFDAEPNSEVVGLLVKELKLVEGVSKCVIQPARLVPWFPLNAWDLDLADATLDGGTDLINKDHPGFSDKEYHKRRRAIVEMAASYTHGSQIPRVNYTKEEVATWGAVYEKLAVCHKQWACREFNDAKAQMEKYIGFGPNHIPQLADISDFLLQRTGFSLRPVAGLLSARDFLNSLAFRVFRSTQYIRHHGNPFYTPEPDVCHELLGHVPLFADPVFADFSQALGLASLAASDDDILRLASVYWYSVEFGLVKEGNDVKAFGAGLLSSFGELEWSCSPQPSLECREAGGVAHLERPEIRTFDAQGASTTPYPITTYQPVLFCAEDFGHAKYVVESFCDSLGQPFFPQYEPFTQSVRVTRAVQRLPRSSTVELQANKQRNYHEE